jgi:hypothetical protein
MTSIQMLEKTQYSIKVTDYYKKFFEKYTNKLVTNAKNIDSDKPPLRVSYRFFHDKNENSLHYTYKTSSGQKYYILYLPYIIDLKDLQNTLTISINNLKYNFDKSDDNFKHYKELLLLNDEISNLIKKKIINYDVKYSEYLLTENKLLKLLANITEINSDNKDLYLDLEKKIGSFTSNTININDNVIYNDNIATVTDINDKNATIKIGNEFTTVTLTSLTPISIAETINNIKKEGYQFKINLVDLLPQVTNTVLLKYILNIKGSYLDKRPCCEDDRDSLTNLNLQKLFKPHIKINDNLYFNFQLFNINKRDQLYKKSNRLCIGYELENTPIGKHKIDKLTTKIRISNTEWRSLLSYYDSTQDFMVDQFTFSSIYHYHTASIFYNRVDLSYDLRQKYNEIFYYFTKERTGSIKFFDDTAENINIYLQSINIKYPADWKTNISSNYLIKAYLNKANSYPEFKTALTSTNNALIVEKVNKTYTINYEIMYARYLLNSLESIDKFLNFNYSKSIKEVFDRKNKENVINNPQHLVDVLVRFDVFNNLDTYINNLETIISEYFKVDISGTHTYVYLEEKIRILMFSYNSGYLREKLFEYFENNDKPLLNEFLKTNKFTDDDTWIINILYNFVYYYNKHKLLLIDREKERLDAEEKSINVQKQVETKNELNILKRVLTTYKYTIIDIPLTSYNVYLALVNVLNRNHIYPFNFNNEYDKREKVNNNQEIVNNWLDNSEHLVYLEASNTLKDMILAYYNNIKSLEYSQIFTAVSRMFGINIDVISSNGIEKYEYTKIKETVPELPKINMVLEHDMVIGKIVLGQISGKNYYFPTRPNLNEADEITNYMMDTTTGILIDSEENEEGVVVHKLVGKVNFETMTINIEEVDPSEISKTIEIEHVQLIIINRSIGDIVNKHYYFGEKEVYIEA